MLPISQQISALKNPRNSHFVVLLAILLLAASFSMPAVAEMDSVLQQADALIRKGDFEAAYNLLEPLEDKRAGDIDYDYLFGIAGVEGSHPTRGAFALERVLATNPNHKDARAEMAKAHFILGEKDAAKAEFNNVLNQKPDEKTKEAVNKFLSAIEKIEGTRTTYGAYLEFGLGWDSNVSSAPGIKQFAVPAFGGLVLDLPKDSREQSDHFMHMAGGISFRKPFNEHISAFGSVSGTQRINGSATTFDNSTLDFNGGLQLQLDTASLSVGLQDSHFDLNDKPFRHAYGATAQVMFNINAYNQAGFYGQYSRLNYASKTSDADRYIIGINGAHVFQGDLKPILFASVYGGSEKARRSGNGYRSQDILGTRAGGQLTFNQQWQLYSNASYEYRDNYSQDPDFLKVRKDGQFDASLGLIYTPIRDLTIRPHISYTDSDSNIETNSYDRKTISVTIRKDFNW
jgi:outer membrane protein